MLKLEIYPLKEFNETGNSSCEFKFSANSGQMLLPLKKIASSGETARVMLAIKSILAKEDSTPVLVFDEVDANVGGEIGRVVGKEIHNLSKTHQVFCVTHLPQVATYGKQHYLVEKTTAETSTGITIKQIHLSKPSRIEEIARMLGDRKSKTAIQLAKELLKNSK